MSRVFDGKLQAVLLGEFYCRHNVSGHLGEERLVGNLEIVIVPAVRSVFFKATLNVLGEDVEGIRIEFFGPLEIGGFRFEIGSIGYEMTSNKTTRKNESLVMGQTHTNGSIRHRLYNKQNITQRVRFILREHRSQLHQCAAMQRPDG